MATKKTKVQKTEAAPAPAASPIKTKQDAMEAQLTERMKAAQAMMAKPRPQPEASQDARELAEKFLLDHFAKQE